PPCARDAAASPSATPATRRNCRPRLSCVARRGIARVGRRGRPIPQAASRTCFAWVAPASFAPLVPGHRRPACDWGEQLAPTQRLKRHPLALLRAPTPRPTVGQVLAR